MNKLLVLAIQLVPVCSMHSMIIKDSLCQDDELHVQMDDLQNFASGYCAEIQQLYGLPESQSINPNPSATTLQQAGRFVAKIVKILSSDFLPIYLKVMMDTQHEGEDENP